MAAGAAVLIEWWRIILRHHSRYPLSRVSGDFRVLANASIKSDVASLLLQAGLATLRYQPPVIDLRRPEYGHHPGTDKFLI